ncbi:MAG TPA: YCF48-related protein [Candidatus Kapabacteria bacterium]
MAILFLLCFAAASASAQWRNIAPNALAPKDARNRAGGAIEYRDGMLWAGYTMLSKSSDSGKTWVTVQRPVNSEILDIQFFNRDTGLVADSNSLIQTTNGGQTWDVLTTGTLRWKVAYNRSSSVIHLVDFENSKILSSTNAGTTWRSVKVDSGFAFSLIVAKDGAVFALVSHTFDTGIDIVYRSTDSGMTWVPNGTVGNDSYSIDIDSCDDARLYVANEDYYFKAYQYSRIFTSADRGATWPGAYQVPFPNFLAGSLASSVHAVYAPTTNMGILRSTDQGMNWKLIGGPNAPPDSRSICALNDNVLFVLDSFGSIWSTTNSGGDSIQATGNGNGLLSISPKALFVNDTSHCGAVLHDFVIAHDSGCGPPQIAGYHLIGSDTARYQVVDTLSDSLEVIFTSEFAGFQPDSLVLDRSDGLFDTISLLASGDSSYTLTMMTANVSTDTLGAEVSVPLTISGFPTPEQVQLSLHYTGDVKYLGSFDSLGNQLDVPGPSPYGISRLDIPNDTPGHIAAWAKFLVFADSSPKPIVTFDSLFVGGATTDCEYLDEPTATSIITPPAGCGIPILSRLIQDQPWDVSIAPMTSGVEITSSLDLSDATIELFNEMGTELAEEKTSLTARSPYILSLELAPGIYFVRVQSQARIYNSSIAVTR